MIVNKSVFVCLASFVLVFSGVAQVSAPQRARSTSLHRMAERGYLGVGVIELTPDRVKALGLNNDSGVEVKRLEENSAAARAGLKESDVILEVNGKSVDDVDQFIGFIGATPAGDKVNLTVWRGGAKRQLTAILHSRPASTIMIFPGAPEAPEGLMPPMPPLPANGDDRFPGLTATSARVGFEGESLTPQLAEFFGVKDGVLVRTVGLHTPAERAGLKAGDVVVKVNGTPVTTPREISGLAQMNRRKTISFTVFRNRKEVTLNVEIAMLRVLPLLQDVLAISKSG